MLRSKDQMQKYPVVFSARIKRDTIPPRFFEVRVQGYFLECGGDRSFVAEKIVTKGQAMNVDAYFADELNELSAFAFRYVYSNLAQFLIK